MAKRKRKPRTNLVRPKQGGLILPPSMRNQPRPVMQNMNILQVIEIDPEKKHVVMFGKDFEKRVIQNIQVHPNQFDGMSEEKKNALISETVQNAVGKAIKNMINQLNAFWGNPEIPYILIHLGGSDFVKIQSSNKEDQEKVFEKGEDGDG